MLHKAIAGRCAPKAGCYLLDCEPLRTLDPGDRLRVDGQHEQALMQGAVVFEVPNHNWRRIPLGPSQEYCRARHAGNLSRGDLCHEGADGHHLLLKPDGDRCGSEMPDQHYAVDGRRQDERHIPAGGHFSEVGREKTRIDYDEDAGDHAGRHKAPSPDFSHGDEQQHRSYQHGRRHRDPIGGREVVGLAETDREPKRHQHQQPIHDAHIDLPIPFGGRLRDL